VAAVKSSKQLFVEMQGKLGYIRFKVVGILLRPYASVSHMHHELPLNGISFTCVCLRGFRLS
jgi:hypothetical protein